MELIPFLKERFNPRIEDALSKMAWIINRDHDYMNESLYQIVDRQSFSKDEHSVSFSTSLLAELPSAMQFRLVKELLKSMAACDHGIHYAHVHSVVNLALQEFTGKKISLPHGLVAERQYCSVIIRRKEVIEEEDFECALSIPGTVFLKDRNLIIHVRQGTLNEVDFGQKDRFFFDLDAIQGELTLRNRRPGDWFQPLGTVGRQKVKKLFIDHKIPRGNRNKKILLADEISVIWIECLHSSDRVKISDQTERVLILEIKSLTE